MRRKNQILIAAGNVFSRKGYHNATLEDIARKAELGKGTIYWYFTSKAELFMAVLQAGADERFLRVKRAAEKAHDCRSRVEAIAREQLRYFAEKRYLMRILSSEAVFATQEMKREMNRFMSGRYKVYSGLIESVLKHGVADGEIRRVDVRKMSHMLLTIFHSSVYYWQFEGVKPRPDADARVMCRVIFEGLEKKI